MNAFHLINALPLTNALAQLIVEICTNKNPIGFMNLIICTYKILDTQSISNSLLPSTWKKKINASPQIDTYFFHPMEKKQEKGDWKYV